MCAPLSPEIDLGIENVPQHAGETITSHVSSVCMCVWVVHVVLGNLLRGVCVFCKAVLRDTHTHEHVVDMMHFGY